MVRACADQTYVNGIPLHAYRREVKMAKCRVGAADPVATPEVRFGVRWGMSRPIFQINGFLANINGIRRKSDTRQIFDSSR